MTYQIGVNFFCIAVLFCVHVSPVGGTERVWTFIETNDGVDLYQSAEGSAGLLPFKAVAVLDAPAQKIIMALIDAEGKPDWAPKLKDTSVHSELSATSFVYSEYYETPWPFKDREFLIHGTVSFDRGNIMFAARNAKDSALALKDHVRVNIDLLEFVVKPLSENKTRIEFLFSGDMGGWIPDFVKAIIQKKWPVRFIQALRDHVLTSESLSTDRYQKLMRETGS